MTFSKPISSFILATSLLSGTTNVSAADKTIHQVIKQISSICDNAAGEALNRVQKVELENCNFTNKHGVCYSLNATRIAFNVLTQCLDYASVKDVNELNQMIANGIKQKNRIDLLNLTEQEKILFIDRWDGSIAFNQDLGFPQKIKEALFSRENK